jgi:predicted  nucleic acid-binding Zn-ribbon protein
MPNVTNELLYEVLKKIQVEMADMRDDISDLKTRATALDEHMGGLIIQVSGNNNRLDRMDERLKRVERRLELSDVK